jgi:hypothetical protein
MLTVDNPWITAIWQPFPLWMFTTQQTYLFLRSRDSRSGYRTIQFTYIILFLLSALPHIYLLGPTIVAGDHARLKALFVPSLAVPDVSSTVQVGVLDFIQWDIVLTSFSTFLALLWTVKSITQFIVMTVWLVVAGVVFGPGSAFVGVFAWREGVLNTGADEDGTMKVRGRQS